SPKPGTSRPSKGLGEVRSGISCPNETYSTALVGTSTVVDATCLIAEATIPMIIKKKIRKTIPIPVTVANTYLKNDFISYINAYSSLKIYIIPRKAKNSATFLRQTYLI